MLKIEQLNDLRCPSCGRGDDILFIDARAQCNLIKNASGVHMDRYISNWVEPGTAARCLECQHTAQVRDFSQIAAEKDDEGTIWRERAESLYGIEEIADGKERQVTIPDKASVYRNGHYSAHVQALVKVEEWRKINPEDPSQCQPEIVDIRNPSAVDLYSFEDLHADSQDRVRDWWMERNRDGKLKEVITTALAPGNLLAIVEYGIEFPKFFASMEFRPDGRWSYTHQDNASEIIREQYPELVTLHHYADALTKAQQPHNYMLQASLEVFRNNGDRTTAFDIVRLDPNGSAGGAPPSADPSFTPYDVRGKRAQANEVDHASAEKIRHIMGLYAEWVLTYFRVCLDEEITKHHYRFDQRASMAVKVDEDPSTGIKIP